jgi:glutaredoxin
MGANSKPDQLVSGGRPQKIAFKVYSKNDCKWCMLAKDLLDKYGFQYHVIEIGKDITKPEFLEMTGMEQGKATVPQIYYGNVRIGGYAELSQVLASQLGLVGKNGEIDA